MASLKKSIQEIKSSKNVMKMSPVILWHLFLYKVTSNLVEHTTYHHCYLLP